MTFTFQGHMSIITIPCQKSKKITLEDLANTIVPCYAKEIRNMTSRVIVLSAEWIWKRKKVRKPFTPARCTLK